MMKIYVLYCSIVVFCVGLVAAAWVELGPRSEADPSGEVNGTAGESGGTATVQAQPVLSAMQTADAVLDQPFTVSFEIVIQKSPIGPDRGRQTKVCTFTSGDGVRGLSVETLYDHNPLFQPLGTGDCAHFDFDADGNLIVWRSLRKFSLSTPEFNQTLDQQEMLRIRPDGTIIKQGVRPMVYKEKVGSPDSLYEFDQFVLASGRGFSKHLGQVVADSVRQDGLRELTCEGTFSGFSSGKWNLLIAPENGHLVRYASFITETNDRPVIEVHNSALVERDGVLLAQSAMVTYLRGVRGPEADYIILEVTVRDFSTRTDTQLLEKLHKQVTAPLPDDATIVDYSRPTPTMYQIGEEPDESGR